VFVRIGAVQGDLQVIHPRLFQLPNHLLAQEGSVCGYGDPQSPLLGVPDDGDEMWAHQRLPSRYPKYRHYHIGYLIDDVQLLVEGELVRI